MLAAIAAALLAPAGAFAYGWPVAPFDTQHAIRGAFDDPRFSARPAGLAETSFHFGVDIVAPDGTPVYAVASGTVFRYPDAVAVRQPDGHEFSYWHIDVVVAEHSEAEKGELLGYVRAGWGHVHFAESDGRGIYVNPLRPGGLEPFSDWTVPVVGPVEVRGAAGGPLRLESVHGRIDVTVDAYDVPPLAPAPPWQNARWTPALVRWRLLRNGEEAIPWRTAADFRATWLQPVEFDEIYAPGTTQNRPWEPGRYVFWLARGLDTAALPNGEYRLEVAAEDTRGNTGTTSLPLDVQNANAQSAKTTNRSSR
jgi:murein DD-endopeptidase MepM/ murein hydrolase activator NlpD